MSTIPINWWAVIVATIVNVVLGSLWYGPIFGKAWMKMMNINPEAMTEDQKKGMWKSYTIMIIGSLLMTFVLLHSIVYGVAFTHTSGVSAGLMAGFWNWLGFIAPVTVGSVLWEGKSWKLWILNAGYYLVALLLMGMILASWM